ncbi:MAG: 16S rRNA (cytidine(1402)-2'-O)-methyltransferase, partial [Acidimicrobiales bacterium]
VLGRADLVCCEDTRRTGRLLEHAGVSARRLLRVDEHTESDAVAEILGLLDAGATVAVVSDAGLPGISDPGEKLVEAAVAGGHAVTIVPGPSAVLAALTVSGLPTGRFVFEGFLPRKGPARARRLHEIGAERRTVVLYESPHRLARTLTDLAEACGEQRRAVVARELTKLHEELVRGPLVELREWASARVRGEVVVVIEGAAAPAGADDQVLLAAVRESLVAGVSRRDAAAAVAEAHGVSRRRVYDLSLEAGGGG